MSFTYMVEGETSLEVASFFDFCFLQKKDESITFSKDWAPQMVASTGITVMQYIVHCTIGRRGGGAEYSLAHLCAKQS